MSFDLNHVTVIGRLTRDVELKYTTGGTAVANVGLAVGGKPKPDGTETVSFLDVVVWGKTAEVCSKYLAKGKQIAVMGHLEQQRWEKDGIKHNRVQIVAERVQFLGGGKKDGEKAEDQPPEDNQPEGSEPDPNDPNF